MSDDLYSESYEEELYSPDYPDPPSEPIGAFSWLGTAIKWILRIAIVVLMPLGIFAIIVTAFRSSVPYQVAVETAQNDPAVIEALGYPIQPGWFILGSLETSGRSGEASLNIPLRGSESRGRLYVGAWRRGGDWEFYTLEVVPKGSDKAIQLTP